MNPGGWTRRVGRLKALYSQESNKFGARETDQFKVRTAAILFQTQLKDYTFNHPRGRKVTVQEDLIKGGNKEG